MIRQPVRTVNQKLSDFNAVNIKTLTIIALFCISILVAWLINLAVMNSKMNSRVIIFLHPQWLWLSLLMRPWTVNFDPWKNSHNNSGCNRIRTFSNVVWKDFLYRHFARSSVALNCTSTKHCYGKISVLSYMCKQNECIGRVTLNGKIFKKLQDASIERFWRNSN